MTDRNSNNSPWYSTLFIYTHKQQEIILPWEVNISAGVLSDTLDVN